MTSSTKLDFIGIGAPRCGTTWLYTCLKEHPQTCMCQIKDINFFRDAQENEWKKLNKYFEYFNCKTNQKIGEFSAGYFSDPKSSYRIKKLFPKIKIILSIRNPVDWAESAYINNHKHNKINHQQLNQGIKKKFDQTQLYYSKNLKRWMNLFDKKQIKIIIFDELKQNPEKVICNLYNFLNIDTKFTPSSLTKKKNTAHTFYIPSIQKIAKKIYSQMKQNKFLFNLTKKTKVKKIGEYLTKLNKKKTDLNINKDTKKYLHNKFKKDIKELTNITDKNFIKYWNYD